MKSINVNVWRVTGYKGNSDYDGKQDNNLDIEIALDARMKKSDVEDFLFGLWSNMYRTVYIELELVRVVENI